MADEPEFLSADEVLAIAPEPPPAGGRRALERARQRMAATGQWNPGQAMGRRWPIGCVALEITQRCNLDCTAWYLSEQRAFAVSLLYGDDSQLAAHVIEDGFTAAERLRIYRNSSCSAITEALRLTYPAVDRLVGRDFFGAAAAQFIMEYPPSSGYLNEYGGEFADFLAALPTASALRYLPDVARFGWALSSAANAADAPMLDVVTLAEVDPDQQGSIRFQPHPSAQGRDLISVVLTMLSFGIGAALPLLLLGLVSREAIAKWCNRLLNAGQRGKAALGAIAGFAGLMILKGSDRPLEAVIVVASPDWLIRLTTSF